MNQRAWRIVAREDATVRFAAEEFMRLMGKLDPEASVSLCAEGDFPRERLLFIGLEDHPVKDPVIDDAISLDVKNCAGRICGVNPRSVLIAVYRFFREAGCVFVRPGADGEYVPRRDSSGLTLRLRETPAYRHRGLCLEGANTYENVAELIDFLPKLGFNEFFTQLFRPTWTFQRWYEHFGNPGLTQTPISNGTVDAFVRDYDRQLALRGLEHHRIGHGWSSRVLGITSGAWHEHNEAHQVTSGRERLIATVDGRKCLYKGSGIDTNLCYSDPEVQQLLEDEVAAYAKANPRLRYIHFWFADTMNNQCECDRCAAGRPSDHYVRILNRIDRRLTREGLDTRIVFLIYLDLLWAPEREVLQNQDRFVLLYAPIRRSYSVPLASDTGKPEPPFARNGFVPTPGAGDTLAYLRSWQRMFHGDSCIFDYPLMWDFVNDPGCYQSLRIMARDAADYRKLGLGGMMSCQNLRVFMPNGLGMHLLGSVLWSGRENFDAAAAEYYAACYGEDGEEVRKFLSALSERFEPRVLRGELPIRSQKNAQNYRAIPLLIDGILPTVEKNLQTEHPLRRRSWECLRFYTRLCRQMALVLALLAQGKKEEMPAAWERLQTLARENELRFQREFDVFNFLLVWTKKILPRLQQQEETFIE